MPKGQPGHDPAGVRHGGTVLLRQETAERLECTKIVQTLDVPFPQGAGHTCIHLVTKPHQNAAQRQNEDIVHRFRDYGRERP